MSLNLTFKGAPMILEEAYFDVPQATRIVGLTDDQIGNWVVRHKLFADKRPGRGKSIRLQFRDLLALGAIKLLIESKLCEPKKCNSFSGLFKSLWADARFGQSVTGIFGSYKNRRWFESLFRS